MALLHLDFLRRHSLQAWSAKPRGMSRSPKLAPRLRARSEEAEADADADTDADVDKGAASAGPKPELPSEKLASAEGEPSSMVIDDEEDRAGQRLFWWWAAVIVRKKVRGLEWEWKRMSTKAGRPGV